MRAIVKVMKVIDGCKSVEIDALVSSEVYRLDIVATMS